MKRCTKEFLLAFELWVFGLLAYTCSLSLPWFILDQGPHPQVNTKTVSHTLGQPEAQITGVDAFGFLLERLRGGCFVWVAHPVLWVGWLLLVCRRWRAAAGAGCLALVLALNVPLVFQPREGPWLSPELGYYLWFASMALLACSALLRNLLLGDATDNRSLQQLAAQQDKFSTELAELKQQVAVLFDHQAAALLNEIETR